MKTVLDVLKNSRKLIEQGWCQKSYKRTPVLYEQVSYSPLSAFTVLCENSYCAVGAINESVLIGELKSDLKKEVQRVIASEILKTFYIIAPTDEGTIIAWNDYSYRTKEQVLELFDKIIKSEEIAK